MEKFLFFHFSIHVVQGLEVAGGLYAVEKPALREAIKTAGVNKVAMVAAIATPQTDKAFADKVENMSKGAIETRNFQIKKYRSMLCERKPLKKSKVPPVTAC